MPPARALAALAATLCLLAPAAGAAPVPYSQLVRGESPRPRPRPPRPRPRLRPAAAAPAVAPMTAPRAAATVGATPAPIAAPVPPAASSRPAATSAPPRRAPPPSAPDLPRAAPVVAAAAPANARHAPGAAIPPAELDAFVDGAVRQALAADHVAGVAVSVVQGGQVVFERGYGFARRSPAVAVDPRATLFRLGSVSKVLTWIEVLRAVETGRLRLDQPVNDTLPPPLRVPADGFDAPVRLRNLMAHDAGFESREFGRLFRDDPGQALALDTALVRDRPRRVRPPGELPTYSSYGAALAGRMATSGRPFEEAMEADLLGPAGLASTTFREPDAGRSDLPAPMPEALAGRLAEGFAWGPEGFERLPFGFAGALAPALSASSTADDMARLMLALLSGGRAGGVGAPLWGPRADAALRTPLSPGWAHGLMVYDLPGGFRGFGHEGSTPAFRAKLVTVPQLGLGVFVAANSDTGDRLVRTLPELLVARFYAGPPAAANPPRTADSRPLEGLYVSTRRTYHGLEGFVGRLTRMWTVRGEPGGALAITGPEGGGRWLPTDTPGRFEAADGTAAALGFMLDREGRGRAFLDPGGAWGAERVDWLHQPAVLASAAFLAELAALLTLAGLFVRDAREYRQSARQVTASRLQSSTAVLWLLALTAFTVFALTGVRAGALQRDWPNPLLVAASSVALAAGLLTVAQLTQLPGVWRSERRVQGWGAWRRLRHSATVLVFAAFTFVLLGWGALEPWSS